MHKIILSSLNATNIGFIFFVFKFNSYTAEMRLLFPSLITPPKYKIGLSTFSLYFIHLNPK